MIRHRKRRYLLNQSDLRNDSSPPRGGYWSERREIRGLAMRSRCDRCVRAGHDLWWREAAGSAEVKSPVSIRTMIYLLEQDQLPYKDGHPSMKHTMQCGHSITNAVLRKSPKLINFHCKQPSCSAVPRCACQSTYIDFCVSMSYFFRSVRIS